MTSGHYEIIRDEIDDDDGHNASNGKLFEYKTKIVEKRPQR